MYVCDARARGQDKGHHDVKARVAYGTSVKVLLGRPTQKLVTYAVNGKYWNSIVLYCNKWCVTANVGVVYLSLRLLSGKPVATSARPGLVLPAPMRVPNAIVIYFHAMKCQMKCE